MLVNSMSACRRGSPSVDPITRVSGWTVMIVSEYVMRSTEIPAGISVERITYSDTIMTVHPLTLVIGSTDGLPLRHALIEFTSIARSYPDNPYYDEYPV